jgi:hypothetical protein
MRSLFKSLLRIAVIALIPVMAMAQQSGSISRGGNYSNLGSVVTTNAVVRNGQGWAISQSKGEGTGFSNVTGVGYTIPGLYQGGVDLSLSAGSRYEASVMNVSGGVGTGNATHGATGNYLAEGASRYDGPGQYVLTNGSITAMNAEGKITGLSMTLLADRNQGVAAMGYNTSEVVTLGRVSATYASGQFSTRGVTNILANNATSYISSGVLSVDGQALTTGTLTGHAGTVQSAYVEMGDPIQAP